MRLKNPPEQRFFKDCHGLAAWLVPLRAQGKTLVTTNGCFDIIHAGHVRYLTEAAALGDLLVVGVNADATVQRLKGPGRPVRNQNDRGLIVAALAMVDASFIFAEGDPRAFLEALKPEVHVKGGDYTADIIERETVERNGGRVEIVSFLKGYSTTAIVKNIRSGDTN
jgi:rfaE bifunctional protein nucleotidyltransferase chain/domain